MTNDDYDRLAGIAAEMHTEAGDHEWLNELMTAVHYDGRAFKPDFSQPRPFYELLDALERLPDSCRIFLVGVARLAYATGEAGVHPPPSVGLAAQWTARRQEFVEHVCERNGQRVGTVREYAGGKVWAAVYRPFRKLGSFETVEEAREAVFRDAVDGEAIERNGRREEKAPESAYDEIT
jgi:hypothetical protein